MSVASTVGTWRRAIQRGGFPHQLSWVLELPWRRLVLSPSMLLWRLPLRPDSHVLELGPGPGYYSVDVARRIRAGHLELIDMQPEMLEKCAVKFVSAGLTNVGYTVGDCVALPFAAARFDLAYMVTVFGEVHDQDACLRGVRRILKPDGVLSVSEHLPDPDFTTLGSLRRRAERLGFVLERRYGTRLAYTANFRAV